MQNLIGSLYCPVFPKQFNCIVVNGLSEQWLGILTIYCLSIHPHYMSRNKCILPINTSSKLAVIRKLVFWICQRILRALRSGFNEWSQSSSHWLSVARAYVVNKTRVACTCVEEAMDDGEQLMGASCLLSVFFTPAVSVDYEGFATRRINAWINQEELVSTWVFGFVPVLEHSPVEPVLIWRLS